MYTLGARWVTVLPSSAAMATNMVALLRAINLAGLKSVSMADLKTLLAKLGFDEARSLLASGNLVFAAGGRVPPSAKLETLLEAEAAKRLKLDTSFFVRYHDGLEGLEKLAAYWIKIN